MANVVQQSQIELRECVSLFSGQPIPLRCLGVVLWDACTEIVQPAQFGLRFYVRLFSQWSPLFQLSRVVAVVVKR